MSYPIEVISVGENLYTDIKEAADYLNAVQSEFVFKLPPNRLLDELIPFKREKYVSTEVFKSLTDYCNRARGNRRYAIAIVNSPLRSETKGNLFGSRGTRGEREFAVVTIYGHKRYVPSRRDFLCYYLIRYSLTFVAPDVRSHAEPSWCFFHNKDDKYKIIESLKSGRICDPCRQTMHDHVNPEIDAAIEAMVGALKASQDAKKNQKVAVGKSASGDAPVMMSGPATTSEDSLNMSNRFHIALSFPGEHRDFVLQVAEALAAKLTRDRVFYDEWYEAELLGAGGDLKLQSMYEDADLVVPFFSEHYDKPWCSMEWETIRGILLNRRKDDAVIPVHLDDTIVPGWPAVNFGIRLRGRDPQQIADIILQALAMRNPNAAATTGLAALPPDSPATLHSQPPPVSPTPPSTSALAIWQEKLDYLRQQDAITADAAQKFMLKKHIEEAQQKIQELDQNP